MTDAQIQNMGHAIYEREAALAELRAERDALRAWVKKASLPLREREHDFKRAESSGNLRCVHCRLWHAMWSGEGCPAVDPIPFDEWFAALSAPSPETP